MLFKIDIFSNVSLVFIAKIIAPAFLKRSLPMTDLADGRCSAAPPIESLLLALSFKVFTIDLLKSHPPTCATAFLKIYLYGLEKVLVPSILESIKTDMLCFLCHEAEA